jgi:hypothetical protein
VLFLVLLTGCGSMYRFVITSPDVPLEEDDAVLYRIVEDGGGWSAGGMPALRCEEDGTCRPGSGFGTDAIADGAEILVWLDLDEDDWAEWEAVEPTERVIDDLVPDPEDPRDALVWERHLGIHVLEVELRLP